MLRVRVVALALLGFLAVQPSIQACPHAAASAMPCCKSMGPCATGVLAPACCAGRTSSGPDRQAPAARSAVSRSTLREAAPLASRGVSVDREPARPAASGALVAATFLSHQEPVPLYLLNASILR